MSERRPTALPLPERRGLNREQAADYVGVGTTKFDEMVEDGRMPEPKEIDGRLAWDRVQLDEAFAALPNRRRQGTVPGRPDNEAENPWDKRFGRA